MYTTIQCTYKNDMMRITILGCASISQIWQIQHFSLHLFFIIFIYFFVLSSDFLKEYNFKKEIKCSRHKDACHIQAWRQKLLFVFVYCFLFKMYMFNSYNKDLKNELKSNILIEPK